jgi:hypothetical protein
MFRTFEQARAVEQVKNDRNRIITQGTVEELISLAKDFNIHQESTNSWYIDITNTIKRKLEYYGVDPESVRSE